MSLSLSSLTHSSTINHQRLQQPSFRIRASNNGFVSLSGFPEKKIPLSSSTNLLPPRPRRIILIRHGQSEGNVDEGVYTRIPDPKIRLTEKGWVEAEECGKKIRELIESDGADDWKVYFYVSPYKRTLETLRGLGKAFGYSRIAGVREEPRLREQDFDGAPREIYSLLEKHFDIVLIWQLKIIAVLQGLRLFVEHNWHDAEVELNSKVLVGNFQDSNKMQVEKAKRLLYGRFFYRFPDGESAADVYDRITGFRETLRADIDIGRFQPPGQRNPNMNLVIVSHGLTLRVFLMRWYKWTVEQFEGLNNFNNGGMIVMETGEGGRYSLLVQHTPEELKHFGLTEEMLTDQEWQKTAKPGELNYENLTSGPSFFTHFDEELNKSICCICFHPLPSRYTMSTAKVNLPEEADAYSYPYKSTENAESYKVRSSSTSDNKGSADSLKKRKSTVVSPKTATFYVRKW
ncbi:hypothetical protein GIB67_008325 [Kingdonia uniflora]|uniref:Uncharacterized protein n=1 Tax=Kingdonia uniflora TaxID=39325 RepID=A0A7J7N4Z2_9MAGN|nr:hypothetical protein GIB67_008325 [Kingdonia uniflora]